jgi:hypothetical protein
LAADVRLNRIGNLLVPNSNYCAFEDWVVPILDQMVVEQEENKEVWSPSKVIRRLGKEIDNEESVYYWCYKVCLAPHIFPLRRRAGSAENTADARTISLCSARRSRTAHWAT